MTHKKYLKYLFPLSSLLFSLEAFWGTLVGYFLTKVYTEKIIFKFHLPQSLFIPFFHNLKIKLHHWISGALVIFLSFFFQIHFLLKPFPLGCLVGIIWHDFQTDNEVFKIVYRNNEPH